MQDLVGEQVAGVASDFNFEISMNDSQDNSTVNDCAMSSHNAMLVNKINHA